MTIHTTLSGIQSHEADLFFDFAGDRTLIPGRGGFSLEPTFTRAAVATRFNSSGILENVSSGDPVFDYDPVTLASLGLRMEAQKINYIDHSEDFDNASWDQNSSTTITESAATGPDGVSGSATEIEHTLSTGSLKILSTGDPQNNDMASVFAKIPSGSSARWLMLEMQPDNGSRDIHAWFDLVNGVVGSTVLDVGSLLFHKIKALPNDWFLCQFGGTAGGTNNNSHQIRIATNNAVQDTSLTSEPLYIYGASRNHGGTNSSYIRSSGSNTTRVADRADTTFAIADQGTLLLVARAGLGAEASASQFGIRIDDGTLNNHVNIVRTSGKLAQGKIRGSAGSTIDTNSVGTWDNETDARIAFSWSASEGKVQLTLDGATPVESAWSDGFNATTDAVQIGHNGGTQQFDGWIAQLHHYPTAYFDGDLQAL